MNQILEGATAVSYTLSDKQILNLARETAKATVEEIKKQQEPERFINRKEFKKLTGIQSDTTIIQLEKKGIIERFMIGGKIRYKPSNVTNVFREKVAV